MTRYLKAMAAVIALLLLTEPLLASPAQAATIGSIIYSNPAEPEPYYTRAVETGNGGILATFTRKFPGNAGWAGMQPFDFYQSLDEGKTWSLYSQIDPNDYGLDRDKQGMTTLYVLPQQVEDLPAGTILFASTDWGTHAYTIHIWKSTDNGANWQLYSHLAARGGGGTNRTWEPEFAVSSDGRLICYYSDERQPGHNQTISREISNDGGLTWGSYSIIVGTGNDWAWRPGMPRVTKAKNGLYFMFYEHLGAIPNFAVRFKTSWDGMNWGDAEELGQVVGTGIYRASQAPEVAYVDDGSTFGRFYVRGMTDVVPSPNHMFMSSDHGATWSIVDAPLTVSGTDHSTPWAWSGTLLPLAHNLLLEVNSVPVGTRTEIRANVAQINGDSTIVSGGVYKLINQNNGLLLDNAGGGSPAGTPAIQWTDLEVNTQWWQLEYRSNGFFRVANMNNNLVLDHSSGTMTPGAKVFQQPDNDLDTQRWKFSYKNNGHYTVMNERSALMLDNAGGGAPPGTQVIQWTPNELDTQNWKLVRIDIERSIHRFESFNFPGSYIHQQSGRGQSGGAIPLYADSEWVMVPGLADPTAISIESARFPGHFLRHRDGEVWLDANNNSTLFKQDATWRLRPGLSHGGAASFESYNFPNHYLRHMGGLLYMTPISSALDQRDATFFVNN